MDEFHSTVVSKDGKLLLKKASKDAQRKLSFMNRRINDLYHQRKFNYKNSTKVKKMIHNQMNQIVKCLKARERNLWAHIDETYISQDANISEELQKLHLLHSRCQVLFNHLEDFKDSKSPLLKIHSLLDEINCEEQNIKPLEFVSNFEAMKVMASNYGQLEGGFLKRDGFIFDKTDNVTSTQSFEKEEHNVECSSFDRDHHPISNYHFVKPPTCEEENIEESFQMIHLTNDMCCDEDSEDNTMHDESPNNNQEDEKELSKSSWERKYNDMAERSKYLYKESNIDFNADEEWKQVQEIYKKIADFNEILRGYEESNKVNICCTKEQLDTNKERRCLTIKEADEWLQRSSSKEVGRKGIIIESPAERIKEAFKPYLIKDSAKQWLSCD